MKTLLAPRSFIDQLRDEISDIRNENISFNPALCGVTVVASKYLPKKYVQSRYPKSKRKRIRKKFAKKYGRWVEQAYLLDERLLDSLKFKAERRVDDEIFRELYRPTWRFPFYTIAD